MAVPIWLEVNGQTRELTVDPRASVLDTLRDRLGVMSVKKGCDHGQCGACTALVDGRRVLTCLCLAVSYDGASITTAEGLGLPGDLGDMQQAFVDHDGFQCGYCTPGQICSAVGLLDEYAAGMPSHVTPADQLADPHATFALTDDEIRERMSGNLCRCGAYVNIVAAIREVAQAATVQAAVPLPLPEHV